MRLRFTLLPALFFVVACRQAPPDAPPPAPLHAEPIGDAGATPPSAHVAIQPNAKCEIHPGYCNFRCRSFGERQSSHHAQRIGEPVRWGLGTCGPYKAFAEEGKDGSGILELFDGEELVGAQYTKPQDECAAFLQNGRSSAIECDPKIEWHPADGG